jgi:TolA-binding protein
MQNRYNNCNAAFHAIGALKMRARVLLSVALMVVLMVSICVAQDPVNSDQINTPNAIQTLDKLIEQNEQVEKQNQQLEMQNQQLQKQNQELLEQIKVLRGTLTQSDGSKKPADSPPATTA